MPSFERITKKVVTRFVVVSLCFCNHRLSWAALTEALGYVQANTSSLPQTSQGRPHVLM